MDAAIVHFPHPGNEHKVRAGQTYFPWNTKDHRRKFLASRGRVVDTQDRVHDDDLVFWGEWEAPSHVVAQWSPDGEMPTALHAPIWESPGPAGFRQNTDPWVFGDHFRYSNCKQLSQKALRDLPRGSLVLFGSRRRGDFVLDTCFVTAGLAKLAEPTYDDEAFETCTVDSLEDDLTQFNVHYGVSYPSQVNGMFSFVPCQPCEAGPFIRPTIRMNRYINPDSVMSPSGAKFMRGADDIQSAWHQVVSQVRAQGLELGVWFPTPGKATAAPHRDDPSPVQSRVSRGSGG